MIRRDFISSLAAAATTCNKLKIPSRRPAPAGLLGFDMSIYVGPGQWIVAKQDTGASFAFIECAHGTEAGSHFAKHWTDSRDAGLVRGAYQRLTSSAPGREQAYTFARAFLGQGVSLEGDDLPPAVDVEFETCGPELVDAQRFTQELRDWVAVIETEFRRCPILYTSSGFWHNFVRGSEDFAYMPLWVTSSQRPPQIPKPWIRYRFWQYSTEQHIRGFTQTVDLDVFQGTIDELTHLIKQSRI
ncbi:MAG: hypothetical protein JO135_03010 [Candidatus Eremiobacteraeota bacterium]|nr:hypothetical protein [Candidatus Eremiobacteraeota bacterium]